MKKLLIVTALAFFGQVIRAQSTPDLMQVTDAGNDAGANQIKNIADATDPQDAAAFGQLTGGTVTSVGQVAGTGISIAGASPITSSGTFTVTNTAPDQTVVLSDGTSITVSGTYPNFTITNDDPDQTVVLNNGTGIAITGTYPTFTVTNTAPATGTVTSVTVTPNDGVSGVVTNPTTTPDITLSLGDILPTSIHGNTIQTGTGSLDLSTYSVTATADANIEGINTGDVTLTTTGTSGLATLTGQLLNIPNYSETTFGTVTDVSVVSANGLGGTVATSTTTPAITLSTSVTGILKGDGTGISAAVPGTDYPDVSGTANYVPKYTGTQVLGNSSLRYTGSDLGLNTNPSYFWHMKGLHASDYMVYENSAGFLNWQVGDAAGDGYWDLKNASGISKNRILTNGSSYFNGGNVGIGTTTPDNELEVVGAIEFGADDNTATGTYAITGGETNTNSGYAAVVFGRLNTLSTNYSGILSGYGNDVNTGAYSVIAGGRVNSVSESYGSILGGYLNDISAGSYGSILGGYDNNISTSYSIIGGGQSNNISVSSRAVIAGGRGNIINGGNYGSILGGYLNDISAGSYGSILGGYNNTVSANYSHIMGGASNTSAYSYTFILGSSITADRANTTYVNALDVEDEITFGENQNIIQNDTIQLASNQILNLNTIPVQIAPAISGYFLRIINASIKMSAGTAYATNTSLHMGTATATHSQMFITSILAATTTVIRNCVDLAPPTGATNTQLLDNQDLEVHAFGGNPTTGTGTATIYITYEYVKL